MGINTFSHGMKNWGVFYSNKHRTSVEQASKNTLRTVEAHSKRIRRKNVNKVNKH